MKLKGKTKVRIKGYSKSETPKKKGDGLTASVAVQVVVTEAKAKSMFGDRFARFAFSDTYVDVEGEDGSETVVHAFASKKPSGDFKPEKHEVELDDVSVVVKPKITGVYPVEDAPKVMVAMTLPVYVGSGSELGAQLEALAGCDVSAKFSETQRDLPFEAEEPEEG